MNMGFNDLIGKKALYPFEHRILNIILLFGIFLSLFCSLENYWLDLGTPLTSTTLIAAIALLYLYYLSTIKKKYTLTVVLVVVIVIFIVTPAIWIFNAGTLGGIPYYIITFSSLAAILIKGPKKYIAILALTIVASSLIIIEYEYPFIIQNYTTPIDRFIDIYIGLMINIFSNAFLFIFILHQYNTEQEKVGEYILQIQKQKLEIKYQDTLRIVNQQLQQEMDERKRMEREIFRLDRLHLVGEMAAGLGHEIRNPMTTVRGFLQVLRKSDSKNQEYFNIMIEELDRANVIITEFLSLAKNKRVEFQRKNLNEIIRTLLPLITADLLETSNNIHMSAGEIPELFLDEGEVRQLILNMIRNGLEAMPTGGNLTLSTFSDHEEVVLSVQDEGKEIEPDVLEKMGTPFFTTKDNGTGLGLAVCYSIVARHNACIKIETGATGTKFLVRFKC